MIKMTFAAVTLSLLVGGLVAGCSTANPPSTPSASASASTNCDPQFVQVGANNADGKVDGDFEAKYAAATAGAANLSDAQRQLLLTETANNAHRLAIWSSAFGLHTNPNDWQPLVSGNCLSVAGRDLYNQFSGALNAKGTTFAEGDAPVNGYNTQVAGGTFQVFSAPGVSGNRKAVKVTLANGTVVYIMVRCGNVVYNAPPPGVPITPPTTKPPTTCAPTVCLTPKSTNTVNYRAPGDSGKGANVGVGTKPKVVAAPVGEVAPPAVATTKPSAITAPGAVPAPATTTTPPPNEGGSNNGTVGGF